MPPQRGLTPTRIIAPSGEQSEPAAALAYRFRAIIFDWDGTAVVDRHEDADPLVALTDALARFGVWVVVVTGTNFGNIDRQFCSRIRPGRRHQVLVCANRGSEVFGFDRRGRVRERYRRTASEEEEQALSAIAEDVRDAVVTCTGLDVRIVYDRLNRRKIDLIPLPEWTDPPKSQIGALLEAVEARLHGAGMTGGLGAVIDLTQSAAQAHGLPAARITSDVKHIEVGLTDKGDALTWVKRNLLQPAGIAMRDALIVGDEFGPIAGFAGSDARLKDGADDAVVISVGPEPNGVPSGVLHCGGGPGRFRALLAGQAGLWRQAAPPGDETRQDREDALLRVPGSSLWRIEEAGFHPALEHEVESRFAVGNGFLGVRGSIGQHISMTRPRTFVAGVFDVESGPVALPSLVSVPDWLRLRLGLDGVQTAISPMTVPSHPRVLDLRRGVLLSSFNLHDDRGYAGRVRAMRLASQADRALAAQIVRFEVARPMCVTLEAWHEPVDARLRLVRQDATVSVWRTEHAGRFVALAEAALLRVGGEVVRPQRGDDGRWRWTWVATPEQPALFTRWIAVTKGAGDTIQGAALTKVARTRTSGTARRLAAHTAAWAERWASGDVVVEGDDAAQRALRFAAYHLVSAANPEDEHVSIGARALTGDAYLGHVFWDTEIFLLPFYTLTWPAAARALLMYRWHTLPAARRKAARLGYRGALYAWESADTGDETTPPYAIAPSGEVIPIRCGMEEHHISADIAYAVWQYWQATGDRSFFRDAGAEIVLETARFWASRAALEEDGRYHIRGVIGPDEYHEGVDDNAYTNGMARWNIERGLEAASLLRSRWPERWQSLQERLALSPAELCQWRDVAGRLVTGEDASTGLIEQFEGFFDLERIDLGAYVSRSTPLDVLLGRERTQQSQVIKQADVVMLLALLWDGFAPRVRQQNFFTYEPRCDHGSSLSPAIHALVAARLGDVDLAERYFHEAAAIDLDDSMGNAAGGVHIAALGGLWQAAVFGFGGLTLRPNGLHFDPHLPESWQALRFPVRWRGRTLKVEVQSYPKTLVITLERGRPVTVSIGDGLRCRLKRGRPWTYRWDRQHRQWAEAQP